MFFRSFRRTFLTAPARLFGGILFLGLEVVGPLSALRQPGPARRRGLLLPGLLLALPGAGVGLRALPVHGQPAAMPDALLAPDLDLAADVGLHLTAQVTLDLIGGVDPVPEPDELVVGKVVDPGVPADAGGRQGLERTGTADPVHVRERDLEPLVTREVDADEACHLGSSPSRVEVLRAAPCVPARTGPRPPPGVAPNRLNRRLRAAARVLLCCVLAGSALPLLVPRVRADDHDPAMPADDPALAADLLHTRLDLHVGSTVLSRGDDPPDPPLLVPVDDPPTAEVVGTQLDDDSVIGEDPDVVHPHLPADVGQDLVPVVEFHPEKGVGQ